MAVPLVPGPGLGDANAARKPTGALPESQCDFCAVLIEPKQTRSLAPSRARRSQAAGPAPPPTCSPAATRLAGTSQDASSGLLQDRARGRRREEGGAQARGRRCRRGAGRRSRPRGEHRQQGQGDGAHGLRSHDTDNLVAPLMLRCSDGQPALPWEDRGEERRKVDERRRRDRERDRKRRKMARGN